MVINPLAEIMERELYRPSRDLARRYDPSNPQLYIELQNLVDSFIGRYPVFRQSQTQIHISLISYVNGYGIGRAEEINLRESMRLGVDIGRTLLDGAKLIVDSHFRNEELKLRQKELEQKSK